LGLALARRNIPVAVYETLDSLSTEARASTFHPRTLEMLAEWDALPELLAHGYTVDRLQFWERNNRELVAEFDYRLIANDTPYPFRLQCPQSTLTQVLKPMLEAHPCASVHMGHTFLRYHETPEGVEAVFACADGREVRVQGAYLCGADGSKSAVRRETGTTFEGMTYEDRFLLVASDIKLKHLFADFAPVCYLFDPQEWVIVLHLPDVTRIVFRLKDEEADGIAHDHAAIRQRIANFVGVDLPYTIQGVSIYRVHQRVAGAFHMGRVLLLGDAAHINNPMGGMGMNSGIHDAYTLAPALAHALQTGDTSALTEWAEARRAFALQDIQAHTDKQYKDMSATEAQYRAIRNQNLRHIASDPVLARHYLLKASMLEERA
jgi:3-(3-hydroxy-phenyl)propionate hydroxylase